MTERKYLHTCSELIDRLSIVLLKSIFIPEHNDAYRREIELIEHDLGLLLLDFHFGPQDIRATLMIMLANRYIWENERLARFGGSGQSDMLRVTHAINGVRNAAKNVISRNFGERVDLKVDSLAGDLPIDLSVWDVWK